MPSKSSPPRSPDTARRRPKSGRAAPRLIGLTGTNGAGKSLAAAFFKKKGFAVLSLSDVVREEVRRLGLPPTRDNLIRTGNALRRRHGADILARRVAGRLRGDTVIDSIRNPAEAAHLRSLENFRLLAVDAPAAVRFARVRRRGRVENASTLEEFQAKEKEEMGRDRLGQQLHACLRMADAVILNDSTIKEFRRRLEEWL